MSISKTDKPQETHDNIQHNYTSEYKEKVFGAVTKLICSLLEKSNVTDNSFSSESKEVTHYSNAERKL